MDLLVSFCNLHSPQSSAVLRVGSDEGPPQWIAMHEGPPSVRSATGLACTPSRVFAVWMDTEQRCFVSIVECSSLGPVAVYPLEGVSDAHSACVHDGGLWVVSTGTDEVWRFPLDRDSIGAGEVVWRASPERHDTHHVNSLAIIDGGMCVTAFGPKRGPLWSSALDGYILDVARDEILMSGLEHPHSLYSDGSDIYVAESRRARVRCLTSATSYEVGGYARGLCVRGDVIAGMSTARVQSKSTGIVENRADPGESFGRAGLRIIPLAQARLGRDCEIDLSAYGPEIYDVVCVRRNGEQT